MANDGILVKLVVDEPELETQLYEFEQETIKIGRGRPGKARKGVDLQLTDATVARVAAVVQVRKENDVSIMDMGSGDTRIDGKKVGARGKLTNGTEILIGNTKIVIYIGEEARAFTLAPTVEEASTPPDAIPAVPQEEELESTFDGHVQEVSDLEAPTGKFQTVSAPTEQPTATGSMTPPPLPPSANAMTPPPLPPSADPKQMTPTETHSTVSSGAVEGNQPVGFVQGWDMPVVPEGYNFCPMHQTPMMTFGPVGPVPAPLPESFSGPNLALLLDVADRLGKEFWYVQAPLW